jgi:hypothetical protein
MKLYLFRMRKGFRTHMTTGEVIAREIGAVEMFRMTFLKSSLP